MFILPDSRVHRGETPFRHGFLITNLGLPDDAEHGQLVLALDVLDPVGRPITVPGKTGTMEFDKPTIGLTLLRVVAETDDAPARKRPVFMPQDLLDRLVENAQQIGIMVVFSLIEGGADHKAADRVGLSVVSALQGDTFRPDYFGVQGWSPHLNKPFGIVRSGPWVSVPFDAEPIPKPTPATEGLV